MSDFESTNVLSSLHFPDAPEEALAPDLYNTYYAGLLRSSVQYGNRIVIDPDAVLEMDPEAYQKMVAEITIAAKLRKRSLKTSSAGWQIHSESRHMDGVCQLLEGLVKKNLTGLKTSIYTLINKANLLGFGTARVFGDFRSFKARGDMFERRWWVPTNLVDVDKQRWRINQEDPLLIEKGWPQYFWAVQDILNYNWYRIDRPENPAGLRRCDYVWLKPSEEETDMGYGHGLGRGLLHKWFMLTHNWMYANDGAESWAKGKIVIRHPNTLGGASIPGSTGLSSQHRAAQQLRDDLAEAAAKQLSRHVLVIDKEQEYEVFGRPESGHESVKWIVEKVEEELEEFILGVKASANLPYDVDPDLVNHDKDLVEGALNSDFIPNLIRWNEPNLRELGWDTEDLIGECEFILSRDSGLDPETRGKSIQIVMAAGAPVHRADLYKGLGLTPVDESSPDAVWAPQAGQPMSGMGVVPRQPGEEVDGGPHDPVTGVSTSSGGVGAPSPGGAPIPQPGRGHHLPI